MLTIERPTTSPTHPAAPGLPGFEVGAVHLSSERRNGLLQYDRRAGNGQSQVTGSVSSFIDKGTPWAVVKRRKVKG